MNTTAMVAKSNVSSTSIAPSATLAAEPALLSPRLDALLTGGVSVVGLLLFYLLVDRSSSTYTISWTAYYLQAVVNFPHFMLSYFLLYGDHRSQLLTKPRFAVAGVAVPLVLASSIAYIARKGDAVAAGLVVNAMYFLVGWHYVKQIFGTMIVSGVLRKYYFNRVERMSLLVNLYSIWALYWIAINSNGTRQAHLGIAYYTLTLPSWMLAAAYAVSILATVVFLACAVYKYVRDGSLPPAPAVLSYLSIQLWYLPVLQHPAYFYVIPLLHSLQYLPFVIAFKRNQVRHKLAGLEGRAYRLNFLKYFWGYLLTSIPVGIAAFWSAPELLDKVISYDKGLLGTTYFVAMVNVAINIHHYFIDNVIWKSSNPEVGRYLFNRIGG